MDSVDIRPSLGDILNGYQRLSYKPETAIAEFVDNSTASYYENQAILDLLGESLEIHINYDPSQKILEIKDNAWGMDKDTFANALTIAKRPEKQGGRNEYGMGMKTAASWFGKNWTVITKTRGLNEEYTATVNIDSLVASKQNEILIKTKEVNDESHYTIIRITNLSRKIQDRTIEKLVKELSSIYRSDINSGNISIFVNGELLTYDLPEILTETIDGVEKVWKKEFESFVLHDGKRYNFNGFVALRNVGNYKETGFALLRRGRVIVGGVDKNFKPQEIFGSANSFQSLRIFGEVHLDEWPVTQAKDAFDWDLDGLKETFIDKLHDLVEDYITKAKTARKKEKEIISTVTVETVKEIGDETYDDLSAIEEVEVAPKNDIKVSSVTSPEKEIIPSYTTTVDILSTTYNIHVSFIPDINKELITVFDNPEDDKLEIEFNTAHPYFDEIKEKEVFIKVFQKYLILQVISEKYLERISTHSGRVYPFEVRETINRMLEEIKNDKKNDIFN